MLVKGGGGLIAGYEGAIAYIASLSDDRSAALVRVGTGRAGVVGGGGAGVCLLFCTGFSNLGEMDGHEFSGWDFALSFGPKWSAVLKGSAQVGKIASALQSFDGGLEAIGAAMVLGKQGAAGKILEQVPGVAKSVVGGYGMLVDTDASNIVAIDIPFAGVGAELGVYYGWSKAVILKRF